MNTKFSFSNYIEITIAKKMPKNEVEIISFSMSSTRSPYLKALNSHFPVKLPLSYLFQIMHIIMEKDITVTKCDLFTMEDIPRFCITFYVLLTFQSIL